MNDIKSEIKKLEQQLASQTTAAEQSAKVAEKLAEADKCEALASLKEKISTKTVTKKSN